ncbi:MAG: rane-associated protein [Patescibacteria group bacterium]|nr:rane-associated protein [Patescibacteria group bacterium]
MEFSEIFSHTYIIESLRTIGYVGISLIVFIESGLFFGFFLPGDSLLFSAGLLASQGVFHLYVLIPIVVISAVLGDSVGYWFGGFVGPKIFTKEDSLFFNKKHVVRAHEFYEKHGPKAIVLARFIPIVRTFVPIVAGVAKMQYSTFLKYNILGGIGWGVGVTVLGYWLGTKIPNIDTYLIPIVGAIIIISFLPIVFEFLKEKRKQTLQNEKK